MRLSDLMPTIAMSCGILLTVCLPSRGGPTTTPSKAKTPSAATVLKRAIQAHSTLGPASLQFTIGTTQNGKDIPIDITGSIKRNDASHFLMESKMRSGDLVLGHLRYYKKGQRETTYDVVNNEYRASSREKDISDMNADILAALADIKDMLSRANFAADPVAATHINGDPIYEITWKNKKADPKQETFSSITLMVNRTDYLTRRLSLALPEDGTVTRDISYRKHASAFPASTFDFNPPKGARVSVTPVAPQD